MDGGLGDRGPERHSDPKSMKAFLRGLAMSGSRQASPKLPSEGRKSGVARREVRWSSVDSFITFDGAFASFQKFKHPEIR